MSESGDGAKEWVTVKLPKTVRDNAREHNPTYGELLTYGIHAYTEGLVGTDDYGDVWLNLDEGQDDPSGHDREQMREILDLLDRIESGVSTVEERTGRLDRRLSEMGGRQ